MDLKVIITAIVCFLNLEHSVKAQSLDSIVLREIQWRIESFVELHSKDGKDSSTSLPHIVINIINWDSADCEMIKNIQLKDVLAKQFNFEVSNSWRWSPSILDSKRFMDTIQVLRIDKAIEGYSNYSIRFKYNYFILYDRENYFYYQYTDMNPCYPTILVFK